MNADKAAPKGETARALAPNRLAVIEEQLGRLRPSQLSRVEQLLEALLDGVKYKVASSSDFMTDEFALEFGDILRFHHLGTEQPLSKDKFEYAMVRTFLALGVASSKTESGTYPGQDIIVDNVPWSLKSEAARNIKRNKIHISKFMELGRGQWSTVADLEAMRDRMFEHLTKYERIVTLRCFNETTAGTGVRTYEYELVEVPKALFARSEQFPIAFKSNSRQNPVPASCYVLDSSGAVEMELYFDGGTERKLQIRNILKSSCVVHATWEFSVPA